MKGTFFLSAGLLLLCATQSMAQRSLLQAQQAQELLQALSVDQNTKTLIQTAAKDLFSAIGYSSMDQQKIEATPKPQPVYCGSNTHAIHVQATATTCNVTVFDINQLVTALTNPTRPCDHSVYNKTCTVFQGSLLLDISPAVDLATGSFIPQKDPNIQGYLTQLGLGNLVSVGMLSINVLASTAMQVNALNFLPYLEVTTGIPSGISTDLTKPFISQLKISGGGPIPGVGSQNALPSFSTVTFKPKKVVGNLQVSGTALQDQGPFDQVQQVSGSALIANNNAMAAFSAYSLRSVGSGITLFQNPSLTTFEAPMLTAIASAAPADVITTGFQVSQNPKLAKLNMPLLEAIGGPLLIVNNSALTTLATLEHLAVVNATGHSAPAIPIPALQGLPGTQSTILPGFSLTPPSVLIFNNPQLYDISALAKLGRCSTNPTSTSDPIFIEVYPKDAKLKCIFTAWAPVCEYILNQLTVAPTSKWRTNGICNPLQ